MMQQKMDVQFCLQSMEKIYLGIFFFGLYRYVTFVAHLQHPIAHFNGLSFTYSHTHSYTSGWLLPHEALFSLIRYNLGFSVLPKDTVAEIPLTCFAKIKNMIYIF